MLVVPPFLRIEVRSIGVGYPKRCSPGNSADEIIDAIDETVGPGGLETLQHQGGVKFIAAVASAAAAVKLSFRGSFILNAASVPVTQVRPRVLYISTLRVPPYVEDATLAAAPNPYGKVLAIQESQFEERPTEGTGVRVIHMEMSKPVPNFMSVQGHRIMFDYRGIRKVWSGGPHWVDMQNATLRKVRKSTVTRRPSAHRLVVAVPGTASKRTVSCRGPPPLLPQALTSPPASKMTTTASQRRAPQRFS
ncbi:hypothetical protein HPB49_023222 [Dermacentor silvarum]|uniref:Uncharacterized protein n=1 Tax=Dermacentor silvarum TaxID=543639 RepID=A0ACB8CN12_DERSI|nr:hypothetical protein HPB49_023222 [Dermacentor silvarum]